MGQPSTAGGAAFHELWAPIVHAGVEVGVLASRVLSGSYIRIAESAGITQGTISDFIESALGASEWQVSPLAGIINR